MCASSVFVFNRIDLAGAFVAGYRAGRNAAHAGMVWCDNIPSLYVPIFYNADSLYHYIDIAYLQEDEDLEAFAIVGTASYNLHFFDKRAHDTLPAVPLEDADMMLLGSAWKGYAPAFTVIHYLDQLDLWHHSIPDNEPTIFPEAPAKGDPDYVLMIVKK